MITLLIAALAMLSYYSGIIAILKGKYKPSIYSRSVWLLIAANGFFSVLFLHNNSGTLALATVSAIGNLAMLIGAFKYSVRTFGSTEIICTILLVISGILWLTLKSPVINLSLGLVAHFIGAVPSLKAVISRPETENLFFWLFFAIASILAFGQADKAVLHGFLYSLYGALFDGSMTILTARQFLRKKSSRTT